MIEILSQKNTNPFYDERNSRNGGGYVQPTTVCRNSTGYTMTIDDTSCGDFGRRVNVVLQDPSGYPIATAYYGSMIAEDQQHSSFKDDDPIQAEFLTFAEDLHYYIPTEAELE